MTSSQGKNVHNSLGSTSGNEFISTSGVPPMDIPDMDKFNSDFHLINDTLKSTPRTTYSGASSSEVFSTSAMKQHGKRPQSARSSLPKSPHPKAAPTLSSSIPLPVKSSGPIKIPSLLKNTRSSSRTSSLSVSRTSTVSNKHTLEIQFLNKNKRYLQLKKELVDKQKPVVELYKSLLEIKKKLEELGKLVTLEEIRLVPYTEYKQPFKFDGAGEQIPVEVLNEMRGSVEEIPKNLVDVCKNLLSRRALIVELLEKVSKSEVDANDVVGRIESLKSEGQQLQESLDAILGEHQGKIENLIANWEGLLRIKHSSDKVGELENKLKEQQRLTQESNRVINDLKHKLEEKRTTYDRSVAELNGVINVLREQIKKLEQDLENERKSSVDIRTRNTTTAQSVKIMRSKISELESEKKTSETAATEMQKKIKCLQEQIRSKEAQWNKEKDELNQRLKRQDNMLQKLSTDKTQYETTLEAIEEQKMTTEEEMQKTIETLTEELNSTKTELNDVFIERNEALKKCAAFEGYVARMGTENKVTMENICSSIEWGKEKQAQKHEEAEKYVEEMAKDLRIQQLEDRIRTLETEKANFIGNSLISSDCANYDETMKQLLLQQECINRYKALLDDSEKKLSDKTIEVANLHAELRQLRVRQTALEDQNNTCPTDELQRMIEEGRNKLNELMKRSIESEQKLEEYGAVIESQTRQMSEMENVLRYRENMAGVLKASRDELILEKESLTRYSQEMRTVLAEVTKEGKMKDRLIKELQEKIDLRERQISKLEKEVRELEANLMLTNEKRFKLQETIGAMEKELQSTKAHVNQLADINQRNVRPRFVKPF